MDHVMEGINNLLGWFGAIPAWIMQLFKDALSSLFDMLVDLVAFVLDKLLLGVVDLLALIPVSATFNANQYLSGAPAEFIGMMIAIRVPEAFAIIVTALGIRFLLGLVPVVQVGR